jgi:prepilin-type N-terminal cleavage/methylation domain-containing protein
MPALQQIRSYYSGGNRRPGLARPATTGQSRSIIPADSRGGFSRPGFSLAELLVSLVIIAILMTAMGSVMVLTGHAVGLSAAHAGEARVDDVVATIAAEQRLASRILERTSRSITFLVDRDHDGVSETVSYSWSGVPGDPLIRSSNGGPAVILIPRVNRFNLSYVLKSTAAVVAVPDVEIGNDVLLYSHTTGTSTTGVSTSNWVGQYFKPDWAAVAPGKSVSSWRVTKVEFTAARNTGINPGTSPWVVRLYPAVNGVTDLRPDLTAGKKDEQTLSATAMAAATTPTVWYSSGVFSGNSGLDVNKGMVITLGGASSSPAGSVSYDGLSTDLAGQLLTSSNGGGIYTTQTATRDLRIKVWGRYKYPGP